MWRVCFFSAAQVNAAEFLNMHQTFHHYKKGDSFFFIQNPVKLTEINPEIHCVLTDSVLTLWGFHMSQKDLNGQRFKHFISVFLVLTSYFGHDLEIENVFPSDVVIILRSQDSEVPEIMRYRCPRYIKP